MVSRASTAQCDTYTNSAKNVKLQPAFIVYVTDKGEMLNICTCVANKFFRLLVVHGVDLGMCSRGLKLLGSLCFSHNHFSVW